MPLKIAMSVSLQPWMFLACMQQKFILSKTKKTKNNYAHWKLKNCLFFKHAIDHLTGYFYIYINEVES